MSEGKTGWRQQLNKWWVLSLFYFVLYAGFQLLVPGRSWGTALAAAAIYTVTMTFFQLRKRRRDSAAVGTDADKLPQLERRMRRGEVPEDPAERQAMRKLAERRLDKAHRAAKWAFPLLGAVYLAIVLVPLINGHLGAGLVGLAIGVVSMSLMVWGRQRNLRKLNRAERRLTAADRGRTA